MRGRIRRCLNSGKPLAAGAVLLAFLGGSPASAASSTSSSGGRVRVGGPPTHPAGSKVIGTLPGGTRLSITVALKPRDHAALASYATEVATPGTSVYRHYLTVAQFRKRFGPSDGQIAVVEDALRSQGLQPGHASPNGLSVPISATAAAVARALSISFEQVQLQGGRVAFANTEGPQFPASAASAIQGVIGLSTLARAEPLDRRAIRSHTASARSIPHVVTGGPQPCASATSDAATFGAYTADELASAYQFSSLYGAGDRGAGQTVALFELEPYSASDISAYQSCYGTNTSVSNVTVDAGAGSGAGQGEAALDIEDVIGLAPNVSIRVYEGPNTNSGVYDTYNKIISDNVAKVISTSWGLCESQEGSSAASAENTLFQEAAIQGQSIFAAAGDNGSTDCTNNGGKPLSGYAVDDPASQPYVTGVGGTTLSVLGPPPSESVWNGGCTSACAGGGGVSSLWTMPSYQAGAPAALNVVNSNSSATPCSATSGYCREVPDVSADANPSTGYVIFWSGSWTAIGGTSAAAPLWAAFTALTNASSACNGTPIGFANPVLYGAAASGYSSDFSDITSGGNNLSGTGLFPSAAGYDMASGLGTPIGSTLPAALCRVSVTNPGKQSSAIGSSVSLPITARDSGGSPLTYTATGLPSGLTINSTSGVISGTPTALGNSSVMVTVTDSTGASGNTGFTWTITKRSTSSSLSCTPSTVSVGVQTTCTATVTDTSSGTAGTPTGSASLSTGGSCTLGGTGTTGVASCNATYTPTATGTQSITADYGGDGTHGTSSSSGFALTVTSRSTSTAIACSPSSLNAGSQSTCTATVTDTDAGTATTPTGTVSFSASPTGEGDFSGTGSCTLAGTGTTGIASCQSIYTPSTPSSPSIAAAYQGDGTHTASTSSGFPLTVGGNTVTMTNPGTQSTMAGTTMNLPISASDSDSSQTLTYSASGLPAGLTINGTSGVISGSPTAVGSKSVTVTAKDTTGASASATFTWTISARSTSTAVSCAPSSITAGSPTTCTGTVTDTSGGTASTPTGTVSFTPVGSCTLAGTGTTGTASCHTTYTPTTPGTQTITANYGGDATHAPSNSSGYVLTVTSPAGPSGPSPSGPTPALPQDQTAPLISGVPKAGNVLSCSSGSWTGSPTSYQYQWNRNSSPLAGAMFQTYTVQTSDQRTTLSCTVTADNVWGGGAPATSSGVFVLTTSATRCPIATGRLNGSTLGLVILGMTRSRARAAYHRSSRSSSPYQDSFCLTPTGLRVGYASPSLLATIASSQRKKLAGHVIWATTANKHFSVGAIRPGVKLATAKRTLSTAKPVSVGRVAWYFLPGRLATVVVAVRGGVVQEVGIANNQLTRTAKTDSLLARSLS